MNSIKKILVAVPVIFLAANSFAQAPASSYDPKAKAILQDVSATAKAYSTITATFSITITKADGTSDVKNGSVITKGTKYKITLENKGKDGKIKKEEYYNDGTTTWVYSEKDNEVTIDNAPDPTKPKASAISPSDLFSFDGTGFKYTFIKEATLADGTVLQYIDLFPENPDKKNYHTVHLTINKVKKQITNVILVGKDGSTTTYAVKTFTPNVDEADTVFQFSTAAHAGVIVTDMR